METLRRAALKSSRLKLTHFINVSMRAGTRKISPFPGENKVKRKRKM